MKKISTKQITIMAMLIAFDVIFSRVLAINTSMFKLGFGFAAVAVCAMLYGPGWAAATAAMGDILGSLIFPTGAYFPGFTVTAALTGFIFGKALFGKKPGFKQCLAAGVGNCLIVTLVLNTLMIAFVFDAPLGPLLLTRSVEFAVMAAVQTVCIWAICSSENVYNSLVSLSGRA